MAAHGRLVAGTHCRYRGIRRWCVVVGRCCCCCCYYEIHSRHGVDTRAKTAVAVVAAAHGAS